MTDQEEYAALESEFARIGTTSYEAFRQLLNLNAHDPIPPGESINLSFDVSKTLQLVRGLPDGAGADAFVVAFLKEMGPRKRPPKGGPGAAGA